MITGGDAAKSFLLLAAFAACGLTACSSEETPDPVAPFNKYGIDDGQGEDDSFAAEGTPPKTEEVAEDSADAALEDDADDFLNEPAKKEDVLADAEVKEEDDLFAEPTPPAKESAQIPDFDETATSPPAEALPAEKSPAETPPVDTAASPPSADLGPRYANEPPAAEDDLFAEPPKEEGAETIPPFAGDAPAAEPAAEKPPADAPPADEPPAHNPPAAPPLDDLFGDAPPATEDATESAPVDANAAANAESSAVMQEFLEAMRAGDLDAAYEFVATPREPERQELVRKQIAKMAELMIEGKLEIEPVHTRAQNKWALLVAHVKMDQNGQPVEKISEQFMVLQDGKWKVAPDTVRADPAVKELLDPDFDALMSWYQEHKTELQKQHAPAAPAS